MAHGLGRLREQGVPAFCPKCGEPMDPPFDLTLGAHAHKAHPGAIGKATPLGEDRPGREFLYLSPIPGASDVWHVLYLGWPWEVQRLDRRRYVIEWAQKERA